MMIKDWLHDATIQLAGVGIGTAKLDAELILAHTLRKPRTWIHMYRDEELSDRHREIADSRLELRLDRVPLAYIVGHKEFYGRSFRVTPSTLIPRPESEAVIEILKDILPATHSLLKTSKHLVDVGTGSGCLGITAKLEFPDLHVTLVDISRHALAVAEANAELLDADVALIRSDLISTYPFTPAIILANLPYVDESWERSPETDHEPALALFAADGGTSQIKRLIAQAGGRLPTGGYLILEADPEQHEPIKQFARRHDLHPVQTNGYALALKKV